MLHLTGPEAHGLKDITDTSLPWIRVPYENRMDEFYAAVDLVVCRAGAMTVSELAATATPSVLVPLDRVRQRANARVLADAGGAVLVVQDAIGDLAGVVAGIVGDAAARSSMASAAAGLARPDAADIVAARVLGVGRG